jgi:integrase/recombinase XerD
MLQEHMGHKNITTTMNYRKVSGEEQKEWYSKLWPGGQTDG